MVPHSLSRLCVSLLPWLRPGFRGVGCVLVATASLALASLQPFVLGVSAPLSYLGILIAKCLNEAAMRGNGIDLCDSGAKQGAHGAAFTVLSLNLRSGCDLPL